MTTRAVFSYENLDDTADLNAHFRALVSKGVITGGKILPVAGTSNVTVSPFYAASDDGMIIWSDAAVTIACLPGQVNYIVLRAIYNAPAEPTLSYECMNASAYSSDPQASSLILFGTANLTIASTVSAAAISYAVRDVIDKVSHNQFLGSYATAAARDAAWPTVQPVQQKPFDFVLVASAINSNPAFSYWTGTTWKDFGNYEQLSSDFNAHTAGVVGTGDIVHLTPDQKAANAGTSGTPSASNRFVTESDPNLILTADQKAALASAVSGPVKATNPVVANNLPVAVPVIVSFTPSTAQNFVNITFENNGTGPFFGVPVFVGRLGLDTNTNRSSATGWFKTQDAYFNGYVDEDGPLFIEDIQDYTGSGSYNPAADSQNVSSIGYWEPITGTSALRVKFNRVLAAQKTVYIHCYVKGTVAQLSPGGAYYPPATAEFSGQIAYQNVYSQKVRYQQATTSEVEVLKAFAGSQVAPSITFLDNPKTGFYYVGNVSEASFSSFAGIGASVNGDTVLVVAKSTSGDSELNDYEMPLIIEQYHDTDTNAGRIRIHAHKAYDRSPDLKSLDIGLSSYSSGFQKYIVVGVNDSGRDGVTFEAPLTAGTGKQFRADPGTESAPGIAFTNAFKTGLRYIGTVSTPMAKTNNAIGVVLNGKTCFVFSSNTATPTTDASSPLMFEQAVDEDTGSLITRVGVQSTTGNDTVSAISFGQSDYVSDWNEYARIDSTGIHSTGKITAVGMININDGWRVSSSVGGTAEYHDGTQLSYYANATGITQFLTQGNDFSKYVKIIDAGSETKPALQFGSVANGIFFKDSVGGGVGNNVGNVVRSAMCFVSGGKTVLAVGRNNATAPSDLGNIDMPLVIEQVIDGVNPAQVQIGLMHRVDDSSHSARKISFGFGDYQDDFSTWFELNSNSIAGDEDIVFVKQARFNNSMYMPSDTTATFAGAVTVSGVLAPSNVSAGGSASSIIDIGYGTASSFTQTAAITGAGRFLAANVANSATHTFFGSTSAGMGLGSDGSLRLTSASSHGITVTGNVVDSTESTGVIVGTVDKPAKLIGSVVDGTESAFTFVNVSNGSYNVGSNAYGMLYGSGLNFGNVSSIQGNTISVLVDYTQIDLTSRNGLRLGLLLNAFNIDNVYDMMPNQSRVKLELQIRIKQDDNPLGVDLFFSGFGSNVDTAYTACFTPVWGEFSDTIYAEIYLNKLASGSVRSTMMFCASNNNKRAVTA